MTDYNKAFEEAFKQDDVKEFQIKKATKLLFGLVVFSLIIITITFFVTI